VCRIVAALSIIAVAAVGAAANAEPIVHDPHATPTAPAWLVAPRDPELTPLRRPSYFEQHAARVERNMLMFDHGYTLERMRERDELELPGATPGTPTSTALGTGLFSAAVVASAHTPAALRFAFDRSLHVGAAIFDAGGMGVGFGGRIW
jgi:hypothetical protein